MCLSALPASVSMQLLRIWYQRHPEEGVRKPETGVIEKLQDVLQVVGLKPASSGREPSAFNHRAISSALHITF